MPVKHENKSRYPKDWPSIRRKILDRANNRCEFCGVRNYAVGHWETERFIDNSFFDETGNYPKTHSAARQQLESLIEDYALDAINTDEPKMPIIIVLTIAHVHDPDPANCSDDNLAALCQRCHNRLDANMRAKNAAKTRLRKKAQAYAGLLLEVGDA